MIKRYWVCNRDLYAEKPYSIELDAWEIMLRVIKESDITDGWIEWHDVGKGDLPTDNEFVFAYWDFDHGCIAQYYDSAWWIDNDYDDGPPPLYWAYLPKPPLTHKEQSHG